MLGGCNWSRQAACAASRELEVLLAGQPTGFSVKGSVWFGGTKKKQACELEHEKKSLHAVDEALLVSNCVLKHLSLTSGKQCLSLRACFLFKDVCK